MTIVISSGHSTKVRGAVGFIDEVDEATRVTDRVAEYLKTVGVGVVVFHDTTSTTQDQNLHTIVDFHNDHERDIDCSIHFNCYDGTASGTECLYLSQAALAEEVSEKVAAAGGFKDRGPKHRSDLFFLNQTEMPSVLVEVAFVDSQQDVDKYYANFDSICAAIAEALSGEEILGEPDAPQPERPLDMPIKPSPAEKKLLGKIEGCEIWQITQDGKERVEWTAKMAVCCDGMPENDYDDPYYQRGTAYYSNTTNDGYLDGDKVPYIVIPPIIRSKTKGVVMGCQGFVSNTANDQSTIAICGEIGPSEKLGEASCEAARRVGLDGNPNDGGTDSRVIRYVIFTDVPATIDGVTYKLQPA